MEHVKLIRCRRGAVPPSLVLLSLVSREHQGSRSGQRRQPISSSAITYGSSLLTILLTSLSQCQISHPTATETTSSPHGCPAPTTRNFFVLQDRPLRLGASGGHPASASSISGKHFMINSKMDEGLASRAPGVVAVRGPRSHCWPKSTACSFFVPPQWSHAAQQVSLLVPGSL